MRYPALDVGGDDDGRLLALLDDFSPTAVEERSGGVTVYFTSASSRDAAREAVVREFPQFTTAARDVDDEDWARRSQENLQPVTVGRITVAPPWTSPQPPGTSRQPREARLQVVILPSMGFGTGHHATTRLCLTALQSLDLRDKTVLDVGTGSGVLALAASLLGAREATGIDYDADAIQSAEENLRLNPACGNVRFHLLDLRDGAQLPPADVMTANLTGAILAQSASRLLGALMPGGVLVVSGLQSHERDEVVAAFEGTTLLWEQAEDGWTGLAFNARPPAAV